MSYSGETPIWNARGARTGKNFSELEERAYTILCNKKELLSPRTSAEILDYLKGHNIKLEPYELVRIYKRYGERHGKGYKAGCRPRLERTRKAIALLKGMWEAEPSLFDTFEAHEIRETLKKGGVELSVMQYADVRRMVLGLNYRHKKQKMNTPKRGTARKEQENGI